MKYSEGIVCPRSELAGNLKKIVNDLLNSRLTIEGQNVELPDDQDMEIKVKSNVEDAGGSFTIKIGWEIPVPEEITIEE